MTNQHGTEAVSQQKQTVIQALRTIPDSGQSSFSKGKMGMAETCWNLCGDPWVI